MIEALDPATFLAASTYTAADILTKLMTVDGATSGLDADLLDGQHGAYYLDYTNATNKPTDLSNTLNLTGNQTAAGNKTFSNNVVVTGNLTVSGTTTTLDIDNLQVEDAVIGLASGNSGAAAPFIGFKAERGGTDWFAVFDESDDSFGVFSSANDLTAKVTVPMKASRFTSDVATGTAPFTVASTTLVANLNADLLDGQEGSHYLDLTNATGYLALANIAQLAGLSVLGRSANSTGDMAAITAGSDGYALVRSGTSLVFGQIQTAGLADAAVTLAKQANLSASTLIGRRSGSSGVPEAVTLGSGLSMSSGGVLSATAGGYKVALSDAAGTGTSVTRTTGLTGCKRMTVVLKDLSHNSGSNQGLQIETSINGSTWVLTWVSPTTASSGTSVNEVVVFENFDQAAFSGLVVAHGQSNTAAKAYAAGSPTGALIGLRISWTGGNFDNGTIYYLGE